MPTARLVLPFPISVNALYRVYRGRPVLSPRYREWRKVAGWELKQQRPEKITGPVRIRIALVAPDRRKRDADNLAKAVLDLLVTHEVIEADDSRIVIYAHPEWVEQGPPCTVIVTSADRGAQ